MGERERRLQAAMPLRGLVVKTNVKVQKTMADSKRRCPQHPVTVFRRNFGLELSGRDGIVYLDHPQNGRHAIAMLVSWVRCCDPVALSS